MNRIHLNSREDSAGPGRECVLSIPPLLLGYSFTHFAHAKEFAFRMWKDFASERNLPSPIDLSGACKFDSLFVQYVFGGEIEGHYEHQYNRIDGRIVDLSHDSADVGRMHQPYLHEPGFFDIPEQQAALASCRPRAQRWMQAFLVEVALRD